MIRLFRNKRLLTVLMFFSTVALSAVMARAEVNPPGVSADIPFRFIVENTQLPAGNYTIVPNEDVEPTLDMWNSQKDINVLLSAETAQPGTNSDKGELVFERIGNKDFLRQIRVEDYSYTLQKSPQEVKLEKVGQKAKSHRVPCTTMKGHAAKSAKASKS
jgi:hypothetical protein